MIAEFVERRFDVKHRNVIDVETQLASAQASVSALNSVSAKLAATVKQATTDKQILYAKYQKIQDFNKLTVIMAALCNRGAIILLPCDFYLLSIYLFFSRLISAAAGWMSTIL